MVNHMLINMLRNLDILNIDVDAFGLNLSGNMGYPLNVDGSDPERQQWVRNTASHNTVVVDGHGQTELTWGGEPRHFADSGRVKVMDADATNAYPETDIYRRTLVTVDIDDRDSYMVDFFRAGDPAHQRADGLVADSLDTR